MTVGPHVFDYRPEDYVPNIVDSFSDAALAKFNKARESAIGPGDAVPTSRVWRVEEQREDQIASVVRDKRVVLNFGSLS